MLNVVKSRLLSHIEAPGSSRNWNNVKVSANLHDTVTNLLPTLEMIKPKYYLRVNIK